MAYAGIQTMLLAYKMRKTDKEFECTEISQKLVQANKDSDSMSEYYDAEIAKLDKDDVNYDAQVEELEKQCQVDLAEITAWEDDLEQDKSNCETEISLLDGYINSWSQALQTNIQKAHTYGATQ